jgi:hypothetical protein
MNGYESYRRLSTLRNEDAIADHAFPIECDSAEPECEFCGHKACAGDCQESRDAAADDDWDEQGRWS